MGGQPITCKCGHAFPEHLGRYGCPNCEGSSMTRPTDKNRRNLYIKQEDYDYLGQIGNSYADGLRKAVEAHKVLDGNKPTTNNQNAVKGDQEQPQ